MKGRILVLPISDRQGASARYRVYQYIPLLEQAGFEVSVLPPAGKRRGAARWVDSAAERRRCVEEAAEADVVFLQKRLLPPGFVRKMKGTGTPLVFDFDDAIFRAAHKRRSWATRRKVQRRFCAVLSAADLVLAGNTFLAEAAGNYAKTVRVLPTVVDLCRYPLKEHSVSGSLTVGWIGSRATEPYLHALDGVLARLAARHPGLRLVVVSDGEFCAEGVRVERRAWSESTEVDDILSFDIGLMPLEDNTWTRGKCGLKALQYMAAGIPAVSSPVGVVAEFTQHDVSGMLCGSAEKWEQSIERLLADADLRSRMGASGRAVVEERFALEQHAPRLAAWIEAVMSGREPPA
jgi:glycosyltransferase involved in cell wall biosynthesis